MKCRYILVANFILKVIFWLFPRLVDIYAEPLLSFIF